MSLILLTDIPEWTSDLQGLLELRDIPVQLVELSKLSWVPSGKPDDRNIVLNRVSAAGRGDVSQLSKARDYLLALELAGIPVLNGARLQQIACSKALQSVIFRQAGVKTPWAKLLAEGDCESAPSGLDEPHLFKPNVSGYGAGIRAASADEEPPYSADGCCLLQAQVASSDGQVHRVEMLGGEVLYQASLQARGDSFNNCLASQAQVQLEASCEPGIEEQCRMVVKLAQLEIGSLEYILGEDAEPWFIDINPVSSYSPKVKQELGFDALEKQADFIQKRWLELYSFRQ